MSRIKTAFSIALIWGLVVFGLGFQTPGARGQTYRSNENMKMLVSRLDAQLDSFGRSTDAALDRSRLNGSALEDQINARIDEMEYATDKMKDRADAGTLMASDVMDLLSNAFRVELFMQKHRLTPQAQSDWAKTRSTLDELARAYNVAWVWTEKTVPAMSKESVRRILHRLEERSDDFSESFDASLDASRLDGSRYEDYANKVVHTFEESLDKLSKQARNSNELNEQDVLVVLNNAQAIDDYMREHKPTLRARRDWARVKAYLDDLARLSQVTWVWTVKPGGTALTATDANTFVDRTRGGEATIEKANLSLAGETMRQPAASPLAREVRHELLSDLPYYGVFDWLEFEVLPQNTVVLRGQVTSPPDTKSRAEAVVKGIEGVSRVINEIEVLPVSPNDIRLRRALYREIYNYNSPLFKYGVGSRQSIHLIVRNGRATLKGLVDSEADKQLALVKARTVPGLFGVNNELQVDSQRQMMR